MAREERPAFSENGLEAEVRRLREIIGNPSQAVRLDCQSDGDYLFPFSYLSGSWFVRNFPLSSLVKIAPLDRLTLEERGSLYQSLGEVAFEFSLSEPEIISFTSRNRTIKLSVGDTPYDPKPEFLRDLFSLAQTLNLMSLMVVSLLDSESFQKAAERGLALMEKETKSSPRTSTRCFVRALALPGAVLNQLSEPAASKLNSEVLYPVNQQSRSQILRAYPTFLCLCLGEGPMVYSYICLPPAD